MSSQARFKVYPIGSEINSGSLAGYICACASAKCSSPQQHLVATIPLLGKTGANVNRLDCGKSEDFSNEVLQVRDRAGDMLRMHPVADCQDPSIQAAAAGDQQKGRSRHRESAQQSPSWAPVTAQQQPAPGQAPLTVLMPTPGEPPHPRNVCTLEQSKSYPALVLVSSTTPLLTDVSMNFTSTNQEARGKEMAEQPFEASIDSPLLLQVCYECTKAGMLLCPQVLVFNIHALAALLRTFLSLLNLYSGMDSWAMDLWN